ncbi:MAG TPA: hypothetical protein VJL87_04170, partial [Bdellovibrionota bacterium]|nr:hypothetical protein [Bdellovibrionota bacterium]
ERKTFLTFDAGDWSEGSIFYTDGVGQSSLTALRLLGYDAVVLGNHDWFSGPFALHSVIESVNASFPSVAEDLGIKESDKNASFPILAANLADSGATPRDRILQSLSQYRDTAEKETGEKLNLPMDLPDFAAFLELLFVGYKIPFNPSELDISRVVGKLVNFLTALKNEQPVKEEDQPDNKVAERIARNYYLKKVKIIPHVEPIVTFLIPFLESVPDFQNLGKEVGLFDRLTKPFEKLKPSFASPEEAAFFLRFFFSVTGVDLPQDPEQEVLEFKKSIKEFLPKVREKQGGWLSFLDSSNPQHRFVNIANIDEFFDSKNEQELLSAYEKFWRTAQKYIGQGLEPPFKRVKEFVMAKPSLVETVLIPTPDLRVCLFGLVTNELVYQPFFEPVRIDPPYRDDQTGIASKLLQTLKESSACDLIIAATHLKDRADIRFVKNIGGFDFLIGGHDHNLINPPLLIKDPSDTEVPIFKSGQFGETLVTFDVKVKWDEEGKRSVSFSNFNNIEITQDIPPDPTISKFVGAITDRVRTKFASLGAGDPFGEIVCRADVSLERLTTAEGTFANLLAESMRDYLSSKAIDVDLVLLTPSFLSSGLPKGDLTASDLFTRLSLVYHPDLNKSWRIATVRMSGKSLKEILSKFFSMQLVVALDHRGSIVFDPSNPIDPFVWIKVRDRETQKLGLMQ